MAENTKGPLFSSGSGPIRELSSASFLECSFSDVKNELVNWTTNLGIKVDVQRAVDLHEALVRLAPIERPWTREALIDCGRWTCYLNSGDDLTASAPYLQRALNVRCVAAQHAELDDAGHAATQLWLSGPDGEPPLMYLRTLSASAEDGRWSWHESGTLQPFETPDVYKQRTIKDRLNRERLIEYLAALEIYPDAPAFFGQAIVIQQQL